MKRVLVVTGGSRGIGYAAANRFADEGFDVISLSRSKTSNDIGTHITADLSNPKWISDVGATIKEAVGKPDQLVLIHNAALLLKDNIREGSDKLADVFQVNVIASQQLNELLLPLMASGSSIHYVGSTLSEKAVAGSLSYVTSKHATLGLMRSNCQDLMGTGIHCTCVCPGFTDTEMLRTHVSNNPDVLTSIAGMNSFNRLADPKEVAETLFFAAKSPIMNGATLHANLGQREL